MILKYLRPVFSPDDPAGVATVIEPAVAKPVDPAAQVEPAADLTPAAKTIPLKVFQERVSSETAKRMDAERQRDEALALAQRLQAGKEPGKADPVIPAPRQPGLLRKCRQSPAAVSRSKR